MINFKVVDYLDFETKKPGGYLKANYWNDFGFETTFHFLYVSSKGISYDFENIKILYKDDSKTRNQIPKTFKKLNNKFFSLGSDENYYSELENLGKEGIEVLEALNDICYDQEKFELIKDHKGYIDSLIRFSVSERIIKEISKKFQKKNNVIAKKKTEQENLKFEFKFKFPFSNDFNCLNLKYLNTKKLPYRLKVFVGKNGTGKTQILRNLSATLSGLVKEEIYNDQLQSFAGKFINEKPLFSNILVISYSAFDDFIKPQDNFDGNKYGFSYSYCGLQSANGTSSIDEIKTTLRENYKKIKIDTKKYKELNYVLNEMFPNNKIDINESLMNNNLNLSSGQSILVSILTEIVLNIKNNSFLMFDEPELHLHPNAISNLIRILNFLLEEYDSYGIISTHSPLILQEIPSKDIKVISRFGDKTIIEDLTKETFGDSFGDIVDYVFDVKSSESNYKTIFDQMMKEGIVKEKIIEMFKNNLSLNAKMYLYTMEKYNEKFEL